MHVPFILTIGRRRRKWILPLSIFCLYSYINKNVRKFKFSTFKTAYAFYPFHSCPDLSCPSDLSIPALACPFPLPCPILPWLVLSLCPVHSCPGLSCPSTLSSLCCPVPTSSILSCLLQPCPANINGVLRVPVPALSCVWFWQVLFCPAKSSRLSHFSISSSLGSSFLSVLYISVNLQICHDQSISVLSCPFLSISILSCPFLSCPVHFCPVLIISVLSITVLTCPFMSCPVHY